MTIIDVREPNEYKQSHVSGAINLPLSQLDNNWSTILGGLDKDSQIVLYCRSGQRSSMALGKLSQKGFTNLINGINQAKVEAEFGV